MKDRALHQYCGMLAPRQIAMGMNAARRNANRLIEDAKVLFPQCRWASALFLAILSIEESGKVSILRSLAVAKTAEEAIVYWKEYRSHMKKNVLALLPELVRKGAHSLEDFRPLFDPKAKHPTQIEQLKQLSLYSDCYGDGHWSEPDVIVEKDLADYLIKTAEIVSPKHEVTAREIELWIAHVGPVWRKDMETMKEAVANWYAAMEAEHLIDDDEEPNMNTFIWPSSPNQETLK